MADEDGSLDQFEEKVLSDEKKKARQKFMKTLLALIILAGAGFFFYSKSHEKAEAPPPPPPPPQAEVTKPEPAPAPVAPAPAQPKPTAKAKAEAAPKPVAKAKAETAPKLAVQAPGGTLALQIGVYTVEANVKRTVEKLAKIGITPELTKKNFGVRVIAVHSESYRYRELAEKASQKLINDGFKNQVILAGPGSYLVEIARFRTEKEADPMMKQLENKGYKVHADFKSEKMEATFVRIVGIKDNAALEGIKEKLKQENLDFVTVKP